MEKRSRKILRIVPFHEIRWLSRKSTISRIIFLLEQLLVFYKELHDEDSHSRYLHLCTFKTLKFLHIVMDILRPLTNITRLNQSNTLDIIDMKNVLKDEISNLKKLLENEGFHERQFENNLEI